MLSVLGSSKICLFLPILSLKDQNQFKNTEKRENRTRAYKQKDSIVYQVWTHPLVYISLLILEENSVLRFAFSSALNTVIMFILFRF